MFDEGQAFEKNRHVKLIGLMDRFLLFLKKQRLNQSLLNLNFKTVFTFKDVNLPHKNS